MSSEVLIIGYDEGKEGGDFSAVSVTRKVGLTKLELVNIFYGQEAEEVYHKLTMGTSTKDILLQKEART